MAIGGHFDRKVTIAGVQPLWTGRCSGYRSWKWNKEPRWSRRMIAPYHWKRWAWLLLCS